MINVQKDAVFQIFSKLFKDLKGYLSQIFIGKDIGALCSNYNGNTMYSIKYGMFFRLTRRALRKGYFSKFSAIMRSMVCYRPMWPSNMV